MEISRMLSGMTLDASSFKKAISLDETTLECHFKWIHELAPVDSKRILNLKEKMEAWIEESTDADMDISIMCTQRMLLSVYDSYLGNFPDALKGIKEVETLISAYERDPPELEEHPPENVRVFRYLLFSNLLNILCWMSRCQEEAENNSSSQQIDELKRAILGIKIEGPCCQAALLAMKGQLINQLDKTETLVETLREVVSLNPNFYYWQRQLYTSLRKQRRELNLHSSPSEEEISACQNAVKLEPESCWSLVSAATMYEEILRTGRDSANNIIPANKRDEMSEKLFNMLTEAQRINPNSISVNIKLAEAYSYRMIAGKYHNMETSRTLFELCEKKWPNNSMVCHKMGKFQIAVNEHTKGMSYFEASLKANPENFPCLMDYLRHQHTDTVEETIKLLDYYIPKMLTKKTYHGKLVIMKGIGLWTRNQFYEAIDMWLIAFRRNTVHGLQDYLKEVFQGRCVIKRFSRPVDIEMLKETIKTLKIDRSNAGLDVTELTDLETFVESLPALVVRNERSNNNYFNGHNERQGYNKSEGGQGSYNRGDNRYSNRKYGQESDESNWRQTTNNSTQASRPESDATSSYNRRDTYRQGDQNASNSTWKSGSANNRTNFQALGRDSSSVYNQYRNGKDEVDKTRAIIEQPGKYGHQNGTIAPRKRREDQKFYVAPHLRQAAK